MSTALTLLSVLRFGVGSASFLAPGLTTNLLIFPQPASSLLSVRLFGCRDAVLATLLHTAKSPEARRRAVLAGAAVDALDVAAAAWSWAQGDIGGVPALLFGGGAIGFLMLAAVGWRGTGLGKLAGAVKTV